jgi:DUF1680 family protein
VRIPGWSHEEPAGRFRTIDREWKGDERININFFEQPRAVPIDDRNPNVVATMLGPLVLVRSGGKLVPLSAVSDAPYDTYHDHS